MQSVEHVSDFDGFMAGAKFDPSGAYSGISNKQYHSIRKFWSSTALKEICLTSPLHFKSKYIDNWPESLDTRSTRIGSAVHALCLEPQSFKDEFYIMRENVDRRTKEGKARWLEIEGESAGLIILKDDEASDAHFMAESIFKNREIMAHLDQCQKEVSLFWECPFSGLRFRARPDGFCDNFKIELKTCDSAHPIAFRDCVKRYAYDLQVSHYSKGLESCLGLTGLQEYFIVVENEKPFISEIYKVPEVMIQLGHEKWMDAVLKIETGIKTGHWPGYREDESAGPPELMPSVWELREWSVESHEYEQDLELN